MEQGFSFFFLFFNINLALSHSNEHVNPLVTVLAPFGSPEKLTNTLKTNKSRKSKNENCTEKQLKRLKGMQVQMRRGISQYLGCLPRSAMFNVVSSTFLQRTTLRSEKKNDLTVSDLSHPHCPASGVLRMVSCLPAWNSPPKYGFNIWALTLNYPFSGCIISTPP